MSVRKDVRADSKTVAVGLVVVGEKMLASLVVVSNWWLAAFVRTSLSIVKYPSVLGSSNAVGLLWKVGGGRVSMRRWLLWICIVFA